MPRPPAITPMLTGATGLPVAAGDYLVEPKWDGVRTIVTLDAGGLRMTSRNGNDVTLAYPELRPVPAVLADCSAVLDAETVAIGEDGRPSFIRLQRRMHVRRQAAALVEEVPVTLVLFDLLWLDGEDLTGVALRDRRGRLEALGVSEPPWITSPLIDLPPGNELLETCRSIGLEGFMVKRADSPYLAGRRSEAWSKVKCVRRREFVVAGWSEGQGGRSGALGSLALGVYADGGLRFVGMAGSGLSNADIDAFRRLATSLERDESPFVNPAPPGVRFLEPSLVAEVTFTEVTPAGTLRHPVLAGFRTDIEAAEVVVDAELSELLR